MEPEHAPPGTAASMLARGSARGPAAFWGYVAAIVALAWWAIFVLPYDVPLSEPTRSLSWAAGFNNRVAVLAMYVAIGLVSLGLFRSGRGMASIGRLLPGPAAARHVRDTRALLLLVGTLVTGVTWVLYLASPELRELSEPGYFMRRLELAYAYDRAPYRELEFAYGPLLFYLPLWGMKLGLSGGLAYTLSLVALSWLGLWLAHDVLSRLRMTRAARVTAFVVLAVLGSGLSLGLQYTLARFLLPLWALLWLDHASARSAPALRSPLRVAACGAALVSASLALSPEIGLVHCAAQAVYCAGAARYVQRRMLWGALGGVLAVLAFALLFTLDAFALIATFARGARNFPLVPAAHVLSCLATTLSVTPLLVRGAAEAPLAARPVLLGWVVLILALLPSAMGRCDPLHMFMASLPSIVLALALLARVGRHAFALYAVLLLFVGGVLPNLAGVYLGRDVLLPVRQLLIGARAAPRDAADVPELAMVEASPARAIALPLGAPPATEAYLRTSGRLLPLYHPDLMHVLDAASTGRLIDSLAPAEMVLVPAWAFELRGVDLAALALPPGELREAEASQRELISLLFAYPVAHRIRNAPYVPRWAIGSYVARHFEPVAHEAGFALARVRLFSISNRVTSAPAVLHPGRTD